MKRILLITMFLLYGLTFSQVGINNTAPTATLDITARAASGTSTTVDGLIVPRVDRQRAQSMTSVPTSTMIYVNNISTGTLAGTTVNVDTTGFYYYNGTVWEKIGGTTVPAVAITSSGFNGTYTAGTPMTASNTFTVTITNNSFSNATLAFSTSDLVLSGVTGLTVASVNPSSSTLLPGGNITVTYTLSGTPSGGSLTGTWTKLSLNTTKTASISANVACSSGTWSNPNTPVSLLSGKTTSGTYTVPYSGGNGSVFNSESYTTDGITLSLTGFTSSTDTGNLQYNVNGTYTGTAGEITFTTARGCSIKLTSFGSCKKILDANPGIVSGQYLIDPDGLATTFAPMKAECDMTTDGGGWTLVLNYLHLGGTNPNLRFISTPTQLPLIGSTSLGVDESASTTTWGHLQPSTLNTLKTATGFTEMRFYGKTSLHSRIMNFKTSLAAVINYATTGTGSMIGINTSFTPLTGHTSILPSSANSSNGNLGNGALTDFPFYEGASRHWGIKGGGVRWELDDYADSFFNSTYHQVWIR